MNISAHISRYLFNLIEALEVESSDIVVEASKHCRHDKTTSGDKSFWLSTKHFKSLMTSSRSYKNESKRCLNLDLYALFSIKVASSSYINIIKDDKVEMNVFIHKVIQ